MPELAWKKRPGRADSLCGKYQISMVTVRGSHWYTAFFVTGEPSEPFRNIGSSHHPAAIKEICQKHADEQA